MAFGRPEAAGIVAKLESMGIQVLVFGIVFRIVFWCFLSFLFSNDTKIKQNQTKQTIGVDVHG